jgi:hypothetical protein
VFVCWFGVGEFGGRLLGGRAGRVSVCACVWVGEDGCGFCDGCGRAFGGVEGCLRRSALRWVRIVSIYKSMDQTLLTHHKTQTI